MHQPYERARHIAERTTNDPQGRNAAWWDTLPMTYRPWGGDDRVSFTTEDFAALEAGFLDANPWLRRHYDFSRQSGKRVLEIGCGAGAASCLFAKAGADITAIDLSRWAVQLTANNREAQGLPIDLHKMDAERLDFPEASFDYIFSWGVLHHSADTEAGYRELSRVLRPGGECLTMVYNRNSFRYWVRGLEWLVLRRKMFDGHNLGSVQRFFTDGYYHRHFSRAELMSVHRRVGLYPIRVSVTHMAKPLVSTAPLVLDEWLKERGGWLLVIEAKKEFKGQSVR